MFKNMYKDLVGEIVIVELRERNGPSEPLFGYLAKQVPPNWMHPGEGYIELVGFPLTEIAMSLINPLLHDIYVDSTDSLEGVVREIQFRISHLDHIPSGTDLDKLKYGVHLRDIRIPTANVESIASYSLSGRIINEIRQAKQ
jgi:hypothetical protein